MDQIIAAATAFKGFLRAQLLRPGDEEEANDSLYHVVMAFDSEAHLKVWQHSPARALGLAAAAPFIEGRPLGRQMSGLAHWFQTPVGPQQAPPPRWKVAVVTWLGILPAVYLLFWVLGDMLAPWPLVARIMLITVLVMGAMTWVVAPQLTRLLKPWLYARSTE